MHILIMGSGGVGGFIGTRLQETGQEVTFVARGPHLHAIRDHGLCMLSETGTRQIHHVNAVERPEQANAPFDLIIFAVKCYDTHPAAQLLLPALSDQTAVLTLQNGIDSVPTLSSILGAQHVIGGATWLTAHIAQPGVIEYQDAMVRAAIGEPAGESPTASKPSPRPSAPPASRPRSATTSTTSSGTSSSCSPSWDPSPPPASSPSAPSSPPRACSISSAPCSTKPSPSPVPRASPSPTPPARPHRPPSVPPARQHHLPPGRLRPPTPRRTRLHHRRRPPPRPRIRSPHPHPPNPLPNPQIPRPILRRPVGAASQTRPSSAQPTYRSWRAGP